MGWLKKLGSKVASVAKAVVNNPIVSVVGKMSAPRIYNAMQAATGIVSKFQGTKLGGVVSAAVTMVKPSADASNPAPVTAMPIYGEGNKVSGLTATATYTANTEKIRTAFEKKGA